MEGEIIKQGYRKPPLPGKRGKQQDSSDTTEDSPQTDNRIQQKKKTSIFPHPEHSRFNSASRISANRDTSIDESNQESGERLSAKASMKSIPRSARSIVSKSSSNGSSESLFSEERMTAPQVTAHSWIAYEMNKGKFIHGKRVHKKREIASLTKIMNLIASIEALESLKLNPERIFIRVSKEASNIQGTTAFLKTGMQLSLYDLMFGIMLPSGNDAAYAMAQAVGAILSEKDGVSENVVYNVDLLTDLYSKKKKPSLSLLQEMNRLARNLGMYNSRFTNPHGLSQVTNYSTADDLSKLCCYAMKNKLFFKVVNTKQYILKYTLMTEHFEQPEIQHITWTNTNKMLWEGWNGVKTGVTPNAGPCLAASVERIVNGVECHILVILICAASMDVRWKEVQQIADWAVTSNLC